jgi:hypothetical protein
MIRACQQSREALPLAEDAYHLAREHGYAALAAQIKPILEKIHAMLS